MAEVCANTIARLESLTERLINGFDAMQTHGCDMSGLDPGSVFNVAWSSMDRQALGKLAINKLVLTPLDELVSGLASLEGAGKLSKGFLKGIGPIFGNMISIAEIGLAVHRGDPWQEEAWKAGATTGISLGAAFIAGKQFAGMTAVRVAVASSGVGIAVVIIGEVTVAGIEARTRQKRQSTEEAWRQDTCCSLKDRMNNIISQVPEAEAGAAMACGRFAELAKQSR